MIWQALTRAAHADAARPLRPRVRPHARELGEQARAQRASSRHGPSAATSSTSRRCRRRRASATSTEWQRVQARFVDDPEGAVREADVLIQSVMSERGYPMDDFDQRAADISVDHPRVVENYREGNRLAPCERARGRDDRGPAAGDAALPRALRRAARGGGRTSREPRRRGTARRRAGAALVGEGSRASAGRGGRPLGSKVGRFRPLARVRSAHLGSEITPTTRTGAA